VDDHRLFRKGLRALFEERSEFQVVGEAADGAEAIRKAHETHPDIVLMDIHMPNVNGLEATRQIKQDLPQVKVVILTVSDEDDDLFEAIKVGGTGYLLKNVHPDELFEMLLGVMRNEAPLSPSIAFKVLTAFRRRAPTEDDTGLVTTLTRREREVLTLVAQGFSNKEIATRLFLTEGTVKNHIHNLLDKLHLHNRVQATAIAIREGLATTAEASDAKTRAEE
jgi:DNA-binding NarL/FixJ family response regulator